MIFFSRIGLCTVLLALGVLLQAQKTAIGLINEQPMRLLIKDGEITEIKSLVPGYMAGYQKAPVDNFQKEALQPIEYFKASDSVAVAALKGGNAKTDNNLVVDETTATVHKTDKALSQSINFDFESAILSDLALETIEACAELLKSGSARSILLKSWYKEGDQQSEELVSNRLEACRQYLETKGVASNIILTSLIGSGRESRFISVVLN